MREVALLIIWILIIVDGYPRRSEGDFSVISVIKTSSGVLTSPGFCRQMTFITAMGEGPGSRGADGVCHSSYGLSEGHMGHIWRTDHQTRIWYVNRCRFDHSARKNVTDNADQTCGQWQSLKQPVCALKTNVTGRMVCH
jgi:hypothetical protein